MGEGSVDVCDSKEKEETTKVKVTHQTALTHIEYLFYGCSTGLNVKLYSFTKKDTRYIKNKSLSVKKQITEYKTFLDLPSEKLVIMN